jgi:GT2 family glycosyltransferase
MSAVQVDVVIVNYRGADLVAQALARLRPLGAPWPYGRIWLVDNSADPQHSLALQAVVDAARREKAPITSGMGIADIELITPARNGGFGAGCNAAWARSKAPYMLLLNPDAQMEPAAVRALAEVLDANPRLGAVSPRTWWDRVGGWVLPCPTPQQPWIRLRSARASRQDPSAWAQAQVRRTLAAMEPASPDITYFEVPLLAGAVLMLRRDAVQTSGGLFDESFFMYFEDAELSDRLQRCGWQLAIAPGVDAVHTWRHEPHKAPLMEQAHRQYLQRRPFAYRALRALWPGVDAMGALGAPTQQFQNVEQAAQALGPVSALSPVPSGDPAWVRSGLVAEPLREADWTLLAPGAYWALTHTGWRGFERLPNS